MAFKHLESTDIYTDNTNPTATINPKIIGALWINNLSGEAFTCTNNTKNANVWTVIQDYDKWYNFGNVTGNFYLNFANYNGYNNFRMTLTSTTYFQTVTTTKAKERSGIIIVESGGSYLKKMFSNAYWSFTFPFPSGKTGGGVAGSYSRLVFPYKITDTGLVIITRC